MRRATLIGKRTVLKTVVRKDLWVRVPRPPLLSDDVFGTLAQLLAAWPKTSPNENRRASVTDGLHGKLRHAPIYLDGLDLAKLELGEGLTERRSIDTGAVDIEGH